MSGNGKARRQPDGQMRALGLSTGWTVFSYLIAGMLAYGAIGWLVGRAAHIAILFPVGMLVGLGISLAYVIHHFGRQGHGQEHDGQGHGHGPTGSMGQNEKRKGTDR
jgi:ATP synthase protein I